jgi:hypothetical protein
VLSQSASVVYTTKALDSAHDGVDGPSLPPDDAIFDKVCVTIHRDVPGGLAVGHLWALAGTAASNALLYLQHLKKENALLF